MQNPALAHDSDPDAEGSLVLRLGSIVAGGVLVAMAAALPPMLRVIADGDVGRALEEWLVLTGIGTPLGILAVAVVRRARVGLQLLLGDRGWVLAMGVLWWAVVELGLLAVVASVLRKTTHHHALAGVTFAVFAAGSGLVVGLLARNVTSDLARRGGSLARFGLVVAGGMAFLAVVLVAVRTSRADDLHTAASLIDAFAFAIAAALGSTRTFGKLRPAAFGGPPIALLVIVLGAALLRLDPAIRPVLLRSAPMHAQVLELFR